MYKQWLISTILISELEPTAFDVVQKVEFWISSSDLPIVCSTVIDSPFSYRVAVTLRPKFLDDLACVTLCQAAYWVKYELMMSVEREMG